MRLRLALLVSVFLGALLLAPTVATADPSDTPSPSPAPSATATTPPPGEPNKPPQSGSYVGVTLIDSTKKTATTPGTPVPGVTLVVEDSEGAEVGQGVTDVNGRAFIPIPGNGTYKVTLDESTLPEGVKYNGKSATVNAVLDGGNFAQFQIGVAATVKTPFAERLVDNTVSGLKMGLIIALASLGLSLIFGTTGLTNFAHGELITLGAVLAFAFNVGVGLPVIWAGLVAVLLGAGFGWLQDRALWRPLRKRGTGLIAMMIVSIGFALLMRYVFQYTFGASTRSFNQYTNQPADDYGFVSLAPKEIAILLIATLVIAAVCFALMKTRIGKATRAVSDNPALAASSGLRVDSVVSTVWILGTALSALAGVLLGLNSQVNFLKGYQLLLLVFAAVTLGGLGTIWGALVGSLIIGLITEVGPLFGVPASIKEVGALGVLILILLVRPQGILGRRERIG